MFSQFSLILLILCEREIVSPQNDWFRLVWWRHRREVWPSSPGCRSWSLFTTVVRSGVGWWDGSVAPLTLPCFGLTKITALKTDTVLVRRRLNVMKQQFKSQGKNQLPISSAETSEKSEINFSGRSPSSLVVMKDNELMMFRPSCHTALPAFVPFLPLWLKPFTPLSNYQPSFPKTP